MSQETLVIEADRRVLSPVFDRLICGTVYVIAIAFSFQSLALGQTEPFDRDQLLLRWSEMEEIRYYGIINVTWETVKDGAEPERYSNGRLLMGRDGWVSEGHATQGNYFGAAGLNRRYGFRVGQTPSRTGGKNESPLFAQTIADLRNANDEVTVLFQRAGADLHEKIELSFMHKSPWTKLVRSTGFHIDAANVESNDGMITVRLSFRCEPTDQEHKEGIPRVKNGVARFMSKEHFFVPIEWNGDVDFLYDDPNFYSVGCTYDYDMTSWKHPLITNWTMQRRWQNDAVVRTYSYESIGTSPPASAFTLSAYGLPEPPFARGTPWWFIVALTAACAITGIGLFIWNRSRKLSTS